MPVKKIVAALLAAFMLLCCAGLGETAGEENLIYNGDFSALDGDGQPDGWTRDMWDTDTGVSYLYAAEDDDGGNCAVVINAGENDARYRQTVEVEPDTLYRVSCDICASGCGIDGHAATISFENTFVYSDDVYDTDGEWQHVEIYVRTAEDQEEIGILLRVGGYGMTNTGTAYFDNVELVEVDALPEDAMALPLETASADSGDSDSASEDTTTQTKRNTEAYLLLACLYVIAILAVVRRAPRIAGSGVRARTILLFTLSAGLVIRLLVAALIRGYNTDINCFTAWSERMAQVGIGNFYAEDYFCDYPPLYMLLLGGISLLRRLLGAAVNSAFHIVLLKLIPIACDLLSGLLVWRYARRRGVSEKIAALLAGFMLLNPATIIDSAAWGQIDSVFTLLIAVCAIEASEDRYIPSLISFAAAMLIKPWAMLFAPLGLFAIVTNLVRERNSKKTRSAIIGCACALGLIYLTAFVFCVSKAEGVVDALVSPVEWIFTLYGGSLSSYNYLSLNALNLYTLLNLNWAAIDTHTGMTIFAWCMFALSYLYAAVLYARSQRKSRILLAGGLLIYLIFCFGPKIHERYMFPAMLLLTLAYACERDKRLMFSLAAMTAIFSMNQLLPLQGGMGEANLGHLQSSEQWLNGTLSLCNVLNALFLSWTAFDICFRGRVWALKGAPAGKAAPEICERPHRDHLLHICRMDCILMAAVTLLYGAVAFVNLGTTKAPQSSWTSTATGEAITFDLGKTVTHRMIYYGGICDTSFTVELSLDGENWSNPCTALYNQGEIFRWIYYAPDADDEIALEDGQQAVQTNFATYEDAYPMQTARYVRISAQSAGLTLSEVGFHDEDGALLEVSIVSHTGAIEELAGDANALIDEQDTVVDTPSYYNSTYFDEIYHARTAYELLHGMSIYEWTHPPLGKIMMMWGIQLFGMTPFGWRFMGALVGVLMVPLMFLLAKQLTKNTKLSFVAMCLLALDSMHFTQTRIATIDSYAVFFIMLMYLFMIRYVQMDWKQVSMCRRLVPLGLCGITMGLAWATKWISLYASVGLAVLLFVKLIAEIVRSENRRRTVLQALGTCGFCLLFFVVIPVLTYYLSYYRQLRCEGVVTIWDMFQKSSVERVAQLQESMLSYHAGLSGDTHYFRSPWYQWPIIYWPMWYYSGTSYMPEGVISSISCMGNPAVWWSGLVALIALLLYTAWQRRSEKPHLIVLIGFASQFLPWVLVPRSTFIYHYFASVPFIILCTVLMLEVIGRRRPRLARELSLGLLGTSLVLFAGFYPLESGTPVSRSYAKLLRWFKWYNY